MHSIRHFRLFAPPLSFLWSVLLTLSLTACSTGLKLLSQEEQAEKLAEVLDDGAYRSARQYAILSVDDVWLHEEREIDVTMTAPAAAGKYPLIIYLPGLGEDSRSGRLWREHWAKSGYAVFCIQARAISQAFKELEHNNVSDEEGEDSDDREKARSSRLVRNNELRYIGHQHFSVDALKGRMRQLFWANRQLRTRAGMHEGLFAAADVSNLILAGFDLGAQTVTAALGEDFSTELPRDSEFKPIAGMVLSPAVNLAAGHAASRFRALRLPMLIVTGSEDKDPYAISTSSTRSLLWQDASAGGKYLLSLNKCTHHLLSGSDMDESKSGRGGSGGAGSGGRHAGSGFGDNFNSMDGRRGGGRRGHFGLPDDPSLFGPGEDVQERDRERRFKQVAAVISTSTAFLDDLCKNDEFARFWLDGQVNVWLNKFGSLKNR
jgi:hypothetical protein